MMTSPSASSSIVGMLKLDFLRRLKNLYGENYEVSNQIMGIYQLYGFNFGDFHTSFTIDNTEVPIK